MKKSNETQKRIPAIDATVDVERGALVLTFANGKRLDMVLTDISQTMRDHATLHGLKQKFVDAAAMSRDPETGRAATIDDKYNAVWTVFDRVVNQGEWNANREGGGSGGLLYRALCRLYADKTPDNIKAFLDGKTDAEKTALRKNPKVAAMIETIRLETGKTANIDTDELLNELED